MNITPIAIDCETWRIWPGLTAPRLVCTSVAEPGARDYLYNRDDSPGTVLCMLCDKTVNVVGANIAYDFGVLCEAEPSLLRHVFNAYEQGRVRDVQIRQRLIDLAKGQLEFDWRGRRVQYRLADLVLRHLGIDLFDKKKGEDIWRLRYHELEGVPLSEWPEEARTYAIDDARHTLEVYEAQAVEAAAIDYYDPEEGAVVNEVEQVRAAFALHLASCWGMRTNGEAVAKLKAEQKAHLEGFNDMMKREGLMRSNGTGDQAAQHLRVAEAYDGDPPRTEKGNVKTDLQTLMESEDPVLLKMAAASRPKFHLQTTIPALEGGTEHPINPRYYVVKGTGRVSARKPNVTNFSRKGGYRETFRPRPGYLYASADYDQIELAGLAQVCLWLFGESAMARAINEGKDLHLLLTATLLGLPYEDVSKETHGDARQFCKEGNYGFPGGMGAARFKDRLKKRAFKGDISWALADKSHGDILELRHAWLATFPEIPDYFAHINRIVGESSGGTLTQYISGRRRGGPTYCQACNSFFQGLVADGALAATWRVSSECYVDKRSALYGSRIVAFVHDEILIEAPEGQASEAADRLAVVMVEQMKRYIPDVAVVAGPALMRRWEKGAETVRDASGRLVVWEG